MVIGTTRKKQFKLINTGEQPLTFEIETRHLRKYNLRMEPEKLVKLPPKEERIITLTYACKKDEEPGNKQFKIPLNFTNGVNTQLEIKVYQTIPDLEFSSTELDFAETKVGFVKII